MKVVLVLFASLTFAFGGIPKDRVGFLCAVYCLCGQISTKVPTTMAPTTKAPSTVGPTSETMAPPTIAPTTASPVLAKIEIELVSKTLT